MVKIAFCIAALALTCIFKDSNMKYVSNKTRIFSFFLRLSVRKVGADVSQSTFSILVLALDPSGVVP